MKGFGKKVMNPTIFSTTLRGLSISCIELFEHQTTEESQLTKDIEREYLSFTTWTAYTGALAAGSLSLDHRLGDLPEIKKSIFDLLNLVHESLQSGNDLSLIADPIEAITEALGLLHKLGVAIRRSSVPNSRFNLSSEFVQIDNKYEPYFEDLAKTLVRRLFRNARRSLSEHLSLSISRRRKRLLYQIRHSEKLHARANANQLDVILESPSEPSGVTKSLLKKQSAISSRLSVPVLAPTSSTSASVPDKHVYQRLLRQATPSVISERFGELVHNYDIEYPRVPHFDTSDTMWLCHYCDEPVRTTLLKGANAGLHWRQHVDKDLQPYVCLSERCKDPLKFFVHSSEWAEHMKTTHGADWTQTIHTTAWNCDMNHEESIQFGESDDFVTHLKTNHDPVPTDAQCSALVRRKKVLQLRKPSVCPLCETTVETPHITLPRIGRLSVLESHIADHLKYVAFFSLPNLDASSQKDEPTVSDNAGSRGFESHREVASSLANSSSCVSSSAPDALKMDDDPEGVWYPDGTVSTRSNGYLYFVYTRRHGVGWDKAPIIEEVLEPRSQTGKKVADWNKSIAIQELKKMGLNRRTHINRHIQALNASESDGSVWRPVYVKNKKIRQKGTVVVVKSFEIVFVRRQPTERNLEVEVTGEEAKQNHEGEDAEDATERLANEAEHLQTQSIIDSETYKEVYFLRHKLQEGFLSRDQAPHEDEMPQMNSYLKKLEAYPDLEVAIIRETKIHKVLKALVRFHSIPRDEEFQFRERSRNLLNKWNEILSAEFLREQDEEALRGPGEESGNQT